MAEIQHREAKKLLRIISSALGSGDKLTYRKAAALMGRMPPHRHSRAVAQMCDLLAAAACLAGVPLLALIAVREKSGDINQKAWKAYGPRRNAIIERSKRHRFTNSDFKSISKAVDDLGDRGNRAAWRFLAGVYPDDLLYRRVTGDYSDNHSNAIDDLGVDTPDRSLTQVWAYDRDPKVREAVLRRARGKCEFCGAPGFLKHDGTPYLESHHVIALADEGKDRPTNVIALCPNDHREAHFGQNAEAFEQQMIAKLRALRSHLTRAVILKNPVKPPYLPKPSQLFRNQLDSPQK